MSMLPLWLLLLWHGALLCAGGVRAELIYGTRAFWLGGETMEPSDPAVAPVHERRVALTVESLPPIRPPKAPTSYGLRLLSEAEVVWPTTCPAWLEEYTTWHREAIKDFSAHPSESQTKLMMHECAGVQTLPGCPGLGDRVRGLMETFKLAVHSKRAFLLRWEPEGPLEDVLQPALIDWHVQPQYNIDSIKDKARFYWHHPQPKPAEIVSGEYAAKPEQLMSLTHADQDCRKLLPGPDIGCRNAIPSTLRSCVFHTLFKPSDRLSTYVASIRRKLFGSTSGRYIAVHLRIGGFEGERKEVRGGLSFGNHSTLEVVAVTLRAAQELAVAANITAPILVLSDNDALREKVQSGGLPGFVSPAYKAKHASRAKGEKHREAILTSFADLMLMAQASCFIGSPSGFTWTAFMWGRHDCFLMINGDGQGGVAQPRSG